MIFFKKNYLLIILLLLAILSRFLFLFIYPELNFPDARAYQKIGHEIFSGELITNNIYMPLYPIFTYITGGGITQKVADIFLSVGMIIVIYALSIQLFNNKLSALIAVFISSLYPHFLFYAVSGLTETLFTFLLLLAFLLFYKEKYFLGVVTLILSILVRPSLDLLNPILVFLFSFCVFRKGYYQSIQQVFIYIIIYIVLMSPWWIHQHQKYGEFVRLSLGDGVVLYSGNNPLNITGGGVGVGNSGIRDMDTTQFNHINDPIERNDAMKEEALKYIYNNPSHFIDLAGKKFLRFWRLWPHTEHYQQWYTVAASLLSYGLILFLSIGFIVKYAKVYFWRLIPIFALFSYLTVIHMITIGSIRYRFPLEPFLIIFASYFVNELMKKNRYSKILQNRLNQHLSN
jgi:4-amino-4-deoxy-L-arabinose transferase-like glycosyltransferase